MMRVQNNPKLRFPSFEGEWEENELGNITKVTSGGTPSRNNVNFWNGNIPWITTSLINFNIITVAEEYITQEAVLKSSAKLFKKGTILMAMYGQGKTRGKVAVLGLDATTNQACGAIMPNENLDKDYLFQNLAGRYDEIRDLSNEGGQQNLSGGIIKEIKISFPTLPEQQKIASFLSAVDEKIQQLSRKKELLEQYKKGVMQQLFSGKLRFKDENGEDYPDWEEKKLRDFCTFFSGGTPTSTNQKFYSGTIPFIGSGNIYDSEVFSFISEEALNSSSAKIVEKGDLLYALYGANSGELAISKMNGAINQAILCIRNQESIEYLYYVLILNKDNIVAKFLQGGQGNLSAQIIKRLKYKFPSIQEQQKIANFLSSIDTKIENVNGEIGKTQLFKKGLLQQMFV
jgi:type I restriction enzyme S subunit